MTHMIPVQAPCTNENAPETREPGSRKRRRDTSAKLTEKQRAYIVHRLAAFESPSEVQKGLLADFVSLPRRQFAEKHLPDDDD